MMSSKRLDRFCREFTVTGRSYGQLARSVQSSFGLDASRNGGRLFFPGDCLRGKEDDQTYNVYAPDPPELVVRQTGNPRYIGVIPAWEPFIVLQSYRDDQGDELDVSNRTYPLVSVLVVSSSVGVGWVFLGLLNRDRFDVMLSSAAHTGRDEGRISP